MVMFEKMAFFAVCLDFVGNSTSLSAEVFFVLHSVHQDASFYLSKTSLRQFFKMFTSRWGPIGFLGGQNFTHMTKMVKTQKKGKKSVRKEE